MSIKTICEFSLFTIPLIAVLVVCTLFAIAATFSPTNKFIRVDFPTFVLPINVTNPDLNSAIFYFLSFYIIHLFFAKFVENSNLFIFFYFIKKGKRHYLFPLNYAYACLFLKLSKFVISFSVPLAFLAFLALSCSISLFCFSAIDWQIAF